MYISNCSTPLSSPPQHVHHLTSMSSLTSSLSVVVNHGPPRSQQVLFASHPCESHKGSSRYHWDSESSVARLAKILLSHKWTCSWTRVGRGTGAVATTTIVLGIPSRKCPDVVPWSAMSHRQTFNVM